MNARFVRGAEKATDIGIGKYREMQGLPEELQKTIILLKDLGYWDLRYDEGFQYRYENSPGGAKQFFWDYKNDSYTWSGAKIEWGSLFWLPLKSPDKFYDAIREKDDVYIEEELNFEASLQVSRIVNSQASKHYGGNIICEINLKVNERNSSKELSNLPDSYEKRGIKDTEELTKFITEKIRSLEIYIKKFLTRYHKINEEVVNFERGSEPKRAMRVGHRRNDLFNEIESIPFIEAIKFYPELGLIDKKILSLAAQMLKVPEEKVRIAMDGDAPIYTDSPLMDEYLAREWEYGPEASLETNLLAFDLIGSSTGEIYVKNSKSDDILYILGTVS